MVDDGADGDGEAGDTDDGVQTCTVCDSELVEPDNADEQPYCSECYVVVGGSMTGSHHSSWSDFATNRPTYSNSGIPRCVGGFPQRYDWVRAAEIDGTVADVDPDNFYKH